MFAVNLKGMTHFLSHYCGTVLPSPSWLHLFRSELKKKLLNTALPLSHLNANYQTTWPHPDLTSSRKCWN